MKNICFILILLLSLQSYFGHAQEHPLARLWKVNDNEIPKLLELERNLTALDKILSQILEQDDYLTNFAGSYINLMNKKETPYSLAQQTMNLSPRKAGKVSVIIPCGEGIFNHGPVSHGSSVGFWARDAINTKNTYIITTGHGIDSRRLGLNEFYPWPWENNEPPPESRKNLIGTPEVVSVNTFDYALIKVEKKKFIPQFEVRNSDFAQYPTLFINDGLRASSHGIHLCKSGHTTHFTCGYIKGFNGIFGDEEGFTRNLIITDMLAKEGDSGGSVISFNALNNLRSVSLAGIHVAQSNNIAAGHSLETIISTANSSWGIKIVPSKITWLILGQANT
ncbi:hypothetical protein F8M41_000426 [Gigaspora margarita]|uniref:Serine protease n=1 Tax=Gigaspora margarita TaxID=4874 RepID=A0A8H3XHK1_GIGMA|nr:hypothetical protein F8M41_000426 [Gigaspora margarita]